MDVAPLNDASPDDLALLRAYEPVVRLNQGELFLPTNVDDYVACCELLEYVAGERPRVVLAKGEVTLDRLAEHGRSGRRLFLRLVDRPLGRPEQLLWRLRRERPRFHNASRLARVGVLSRIVDALMRVTLLFRGKVARGTEASAETVYRERMRPDHHPYYGRVVRSAGYVALQYWFFYAFNDWRSRAYGVNDHEADWEQVVVYLAEQPEGPPLPAWVVFSAHDETGDDLRRRWDDPDLSRVGDHPVVFAGLGSHSGAYLPGEYLTTFDPPAFQRMIRLFRRITRALLVWTRESAHAGVGIPYVDYARGDGVAIGPGQPRQWSPVVIDDRTPWVFEYQGLWGNDTADPLGGERGPAGPRYERSGAVRQSWGDLVGWSGLSKVPPNEVVAAELVRVRLDELAEEVSALDEEVDRGRRTLRADTASGMTVSRAQEQALDQLAARRIALSDERRRLEANLDRPAPPAGPHDHLRHRRLPAPTETKSRRRVLTVWSAVSTPFVLLAIGLAFLPSHSVSVTGALVFWVLVLLSIEAIARRSFARFALTIVALALLFVVVTTLAGLTVFFGWQVTVAVIFFALALVLLLANVQELKRD